MFSAEAIFSCLGSSVTAAGQLPEVVSLPSATSSLWILPSGAAA